MNKRTKNKKLKKIKKNKSKNKIGGSNEKEPNELIVENEANEANKKEVIVANEANRENRTNRKEENRSNKTNNSNSSQSTKKSTPPRQLVYGTTNDKKIYDYMIVEESSFGDDKGFPLEIETGYSFYESVLYKPLKSTGIPCKLNDTDDIYIYEEDDYSTSTGNVSQGYRVNNKHHGKYIPLKFKQASSRFFSGKKYFRIEDNYYRNNFLFFVFPTKNKYTKETFQNEDNMTPFLKSVNNKLESSSFQALLEKDRKKYSIRPIKYIYKNGRKQLIKD